MFYCFICTTIFTCYFKVLILCLLCHLLRLYIFFGWIQNFSSCHNPFFHRVMQNLHETFMCPCLYLQNLCVRCLRAKYLHALLNDVVTLFTGSLSKQSSIVRPFCTEHKLVNLPETVTQMDLMIRFMRNNSHRVSTSNSWVTQRWNAVYLQHFASVPTTVVKERHGACNQNNKSAFVGAEIEQPL